MTSVLTITVTDDSELDTLKSRAAENGRTIDQEAQAVLQQALARRPDNMADRLRAIFEPIGGADDLKIPIRSASKDSPFEFGFDEPDEP